MTQYYLGIDVGGTFTDFVVVETRTGRRFREKCLTTPDDPVRGIMFGIGKLCAGSGIPPSAFDRILHATTLVTNTLIERKGVKTGLITTRGFRDVLELGNDLRYDMYDLAIRFPAPLAERRHRLGVRERVGATGESLVVPEPADILEAVGALREEGVRSIAVSFLHSYRNSDHEEFALETIAAAHPDLEVSISSRVAPEIREYERTTTVVANAYVKPIARSYLNRLEASLRSEGLGAPVLVMLSNGGVTSPKAAAEIPIRLLESGPAAGVLAACYSASSDPRRNLLAFDMGGTTAKGCFIDAGIPAFTGAFEAARIKPEFRGSGMPLKIPSVEMIEIGAGGGSIASIDGTGLLKVGPQSAGADPGPACYGRGGGHATVTDADLILGYLDANHFLGGEMKLDLEAARAVFSELGRRSGAEPSQAAAGVVRVVNENMATAIRIHAAERGKDYRAYSLFAFGGAGPVHCYEIARILGIRRIVSPLGASTNSAFGLLVAPAAVDLSQSYIVELAEVDWKHLNKLYRDLERAALGILEGAGETDITFTRSAEARFSGQGFELDIPIPSGRLGPASMEVIRGNFIAAYRNLYNAEPSNISVQVVTWRLRASGAMQTLASIAGERHAAAARPNRPAYFPEAGRSLDTRVIDRYALEPGVVIKGPALLEERDSTLVVGPSGVATVADDLSVVITMGD